MKNTWKIAALVAATLALAGCSGQNGQNQPSSSQGPAAEAPAESANQPAPGNGVINSIKDAMGLGKTMKCSYGESGISSTAYIDGQKYKADVASDPVSHVIFDGNTIYTWTEGQKQGIKMDLACIQALNKSDSQGNPNATTSDLTGQKAIENAQNVSCQPTGDIDFSAPKDVAFTDQCAMLKDVMKNAPSVGSTPKN